MSVRKFIDRHMYINIHKYMYSVHVYIENISQRMCEKLVASVASREQKYFTGGETGWREHFFFYHKPFCNNLIWNRERYTISDNEIIKNLTKSQRLPTVPDKR